MGKRLDYEYVKNYVKNIGYELIDNVYKGQLQKLTLKDYEGYFYLTDFNTLKKGIKSRRFCKYNPFTVQNINLWCISNGKLFRLLSDFYPNSVTKLKWQCLKPDCGEVFNATWSSVKSGYGCTICRGYEIGKYNSLAVKNKKLSQEWDYIKNGELTPYMVTANSSRRLVYWICSNCAHSWKASIRNRHITGCPICSSKSKGEDTIAQFLDKNNIKYQRQHNFDDLKNMVKLRLDFYLLEKNIVLEYHGLQHYEPVDFAGRGYEWALEQFKNNQIRDQIKRQYCRDKNIKLLEIPYWNFDKIEEILQKEIIEN